MGVLRELIACVENVGEDEVVRTAVNGVGELARRVGFGITGSRSGSLSSVREDVIKVCVTSLMEMIGSPYGKFHLIFPNDVKLKVVRVLRHRGVKRRPSFTAVGAIAALFISIWHILASAASASDHNCSIGEAI